MSIKLSLTVGDGLDDFEFLFIAHSNFQSKVTPKSSNLYVHYGKYLHQIDYQPELFLNKTVDSKQETLPLLLKSKYEM